MTLFILLPAYHEEASIPALLPRIFDVAATLACRTRIVLVDDGSRDETVARTRELAAALNAVPIDIVPHPINRGLGETIRDGIEFCVAHGGPGDVVVRMDCDDSQDPAYIPALLAKIDAGHDVVITSRYQPGGGDTGLTGYRKWLSWGAGLFMKACFPIRGLRDYSSGYRAYRWEILRDALAIYGNRFIEQKLLGFSCTLEKVVKLEMIGARFAEVAHVLYYDRKKSPSKMASRPTMLGYLLLALKYNPIFGVARRGWRGRIADYYAGRDTAARHDSAPRAATIETHSPPLESAPCAASSAA